MTLLTVVQRVIFSRLLCQPIRKMVALHLPSPTPTRGDQKSMTCSKMEMIIGLGMEKKLIHPILRLLWKVVLSFKRPNKLMMISTMIAGHLMIEHIFLEIRFATIFPRSI